MLTGTWESRGLDFDEGRKKTFRAPGEEAAANTKIKTLVQLRPSSEKMAQ